ncbi:unnamed protein product [Rhodiola kirilowii]
MVEKSSVGTLSKYLKMSSVGGKRRDDNDSDEDSDNECNGSKDPVLQACYIMKPFKIVI